MIVPMKKAQIIIQAKDDNAAVAKLRDLGLLHVEHQQAPAGKDITAIHEDLGLLNTALNILSDQEPNRRPSLGQGKELADWQAIARHSVDAQKRIEHLREYSRNLENKIIEWQLWGDFDPEEIQSLSQKGVYVRLYQIPAKEMHRLPADVVVKRIFSAKGLVGCVVISKEKVDIHFKEITLPKMGLARMRARLAEDMRVEGSIKEDLKRHAVYLEGFLRIKRGLQKELEFKESLQGMGQVADLKYLTGYIPFDAVDLLTEAARSHHWGIMIEDPSGEDRVPTLLRNPRWVSIINPVFRLISVVPGYRELDISLWFLLFFSVFFGMLIGDAGYGLIFLGLTFFSQRKWGRKTENSSIFMLFYILSSSAILWGLLSATFFGQEWIAGFAKPIIPALRDDARVQSFCFLLGALHLSIAHLWRFILKFPSLSAWADIGWISILWAAFFLAKFLILGHTFPVFGRGLIIAGAGAVLFFSNPNKNLFKCVGGGLGILLLNLMNNFTDVVSYVRLFAVGLATVAVADAFNKMALSIGFNSIFAGIATGLILILGHSLNILLGPMSVLVHGVRLNVLEFCNHLDIKWSGFNYRPLKN
ncbi:MAG: hypothetical protein V1884_00740 [Candidatus Omnitrophota bacterium]